MVFVREAINNVSGHRLLSIATTMTIALILMVFGLFLLVFFNLRGLGGTIRGQVMVTTYLRDNLSLEQMRDIEERLRQQPAVADVKFTSKEQALQEFQNRLQGQAALLQSLGENPLPASFDIKLKPSYQTPEAVKALSEGLKLIEGVDEVQDGLDWLDRFTVFANFIRVIGLSIGFLLGIAVITITANTIRLSIYARREEIELMRLIGAKEGFIRAPFFIEGAVVGFLGAIIALLSLAGLFFIFERRFILGDQILWKDLPFAFLPYEVLLLLLVLATFLGGMGGFFSARSFMNVKMRRGQR
ncbi:MAG: permease-like cell division protein FtsX [Nitrospira sp.]|nr:permease-like cell division protein FtsX [Nitrospira sp.]